MKIFDARRFLCRGGLAVLLGFTVSLAVAQDDPGNPGTAPFGSLGVPDDPGLGVPDTEAAPEFNSDAPSGRKDQIGPYQIRRATADYMAGRLRVRDPATGAVRGVRPTEVLVIQNSRVVRRGETDVDGVVQIKDLPLGIYTVVARGPDGAGVFSFQVLPPVKGVSVSPYRFNALIVPTADLEAAGPPNAGVAPVPNGVPLPAGVTPAAPLTIAPVPVSTTNQVTGDEVAPAPAVDQFAANGDIRTPMRGEALLIHNNGRVGLGKVVVPSPGSSTLIPMANLTISFIREGQILDQVTTDDQGYCDPVGLKPGIYSMVGYGPNGFVALGAEVIDASEAYSPTAAAESETDRQFVALLQGGSQVWGVGGAPQSALAYFPAPFGQGPALAGPAAGLPPAPPLGFAPGMGGGGGGFGGGGGGLFGGGGLLGALLGAGAGAGVAAAIANGNDDDDNNGGNRPRPPASPFTP